MSTDTSPVGDGDDNDDPDGDPEMMQGAAAQPDQAEGADDAAETGG